MIYTLGVLSLMLAGTLSVFSVLGWSRPDPRTEEFLAHPGAIQQLRDQGNGSGARSAEISPLVQQAELFALYLNPPKVPERPSNLVQTVSSVPPVPPVRPEGQRVRSAICN